MAWEPSLGAFFGPLAFMVLVDSLYFLLILLQLRRHPERRYELKEPPTADETQRLAGPGMESPSPAHSMVENEHSFRSQLVGVASTLGLFLLLWAFGALAVSQDPAFLPAPSSLSSSSSASSSSSSSTGAALALTGSCLFGLTALLLAAFLLSHHAASRSDVRGIWARSCSCCPRRPLRPLTLLPLPEAASSSATAVAMVTASSVSSRGNGEGKCGVEAESNCGGTNRSVASLRPSAKLTNLQVEAAAAAQCRTAAPPPPLLTTPSAPPPLPNSSALLDNSLTEHSLDNDIKMHVAPIELQFRPAPSVAPSNIGPGGPPAASSGGGVSNGHAGGVSNGGRHHKNRARARERASRLAVLREYAYDVPTSVEGSVQSAPQRSRGGQQTRASRRAAYMAYRQRHMQQLPDSSDASESQQPQRRPRHDRHDRQRPNSHSLPLPVPSGTDTHTHASNLTHTLASSLAAGLGNGVSGSLANGTSADPVLGSCVDMGLGSALVDGGSCSVAEDLGSALGSAVGAGSALTNGNVSHAAGGADEGGGASETVTPPPSLMPLPLGLEPRPKVQSYGLNLASAVGPHKDSVHQNPLSLGPERPSSGNIRTGLWKHETTV